MKNFNSLRHIILTISIFFLSFPFCSGRAIESTDYYTANLKCENRANPMGIQTPKVHLSWQVQSDQRKQSQTAYHILVSDNREALLRNKGNIWDSDVVKSDQSIQIEYSGLPLCSEKKYFWKVKIINQSGKETGWSEIANWQMGLLATSDWDNAKWISYFNLPDSMRLVPGIHSLSGEQLGEKAMGRSIVPLFRKEFSVGRKIKKATLYISGLGHYEATINGQKVGESFLAPGWTDYDKVNLYNTYDVSAQLKKGNNAIGVIVGNGFYNINRERYRKLAIAYGYPKMISKLKIEYTDGTAASIVSGTDWKCTPSPIVFSSIYGGEDYDATLEQKGWNLPDFNDSKWRPSLTSASTSAQLTTETDYPLIVRKVIHVKKTEQTEPGKYLYDFGQNCSGIIELKISGKKGSVVKLIPGELITKDKKINQVASGSPYYFTYTLKGDGIEVWRPRFTYYGFRYLAVEGAAPTSEKTDTSMPKIIDLKLLHTSNSAPKIGEFSCSNHLFNQTYQLIDWAVRSNLQSIATDCPHREKLGWLEQTYLMGASMFYNYDLHPLYNKIVHDMIVSQLSNGLVPDIAPEFVPFEGGFRDSPEWGSAAIILPWMLWQWHGDSSIVKEAMPMMKRYADYLGTKADDHIVSHGLGDWFDYGPKIPGEAQLTPKSLTATAIYYYDIVLLSKMMELTSNTEDAGKMKALAGEVKLAFNRKFFNNQTKVYSTGSQTAMSMPLCVGLVEEQDRTKVLQNLEDSIRIQGKPLTAGDIGFHFLVEALTNGGKSELLFEMNNRDDVPGYGFQLKKGATALTESWPALEEVSNNHLMLGHIMEWFYNGLGGIKQQQNSVAFKELLISPAIVGDITQTKTSFVSPYGTIKSEWSREGKKLSMYVEVPFNTSATISFPTLDRNSIIENVNPIDNQKDIQYLSAENGKSLYRVGSGCYNFILKMD